MTETTNLARSLAVSGITRRDLMKRSFVLGIGAVSGGALLVACAEDDDDSAPAEEPDTDDEDAVPEDDDSEPIEEPGTDDELVDDDTEDQVDDDADEPDDDRYGGRLTTMAQASLNSLHPDDVGLSVQWVAITNIHDALIGVDEVFDIELELATDYEISDDGLTYSFNLEHDVLFHDGEPFTSADVKYTYEWFMDSDNPAISAAEFASVDSIEAPDDHTVVINMSGPDAAFLRRGIVLNILPQHYHEEVGYEAHSAQPIGTGPFMLAQWSPDDLTLLEAFDDHWRGRPYLDEFEIRVVPEGSVRTLELESGNADTSIWNTDTDDALRLLEEPHLVDYVAASIGLNKFSINHNHPVFAEREVRQALMYGIDRERVIDLVYLDRAEVATGPVPPSVELWYESDVRTYEYNPDRARELLDEAGWVDEDGDGIREKDGIPLNWECLIFIGDGPQRPQAELVQEQLLDIGADMEIREAPYASDAVLEDRADSAIHNRVYSGSNGEPDMTSHLHSTGGRNYNHYVSEEMDALLEEGLLESDPDARREIYSEVQRLFAEDVPCLYMSYWDWFIFWNERIKGLPDPENVDRAMQLYRKVNQLWIEE